MLMFTFKDFIYGDSLDPLLGIGMNDRVSIKLITWNRIIEHGIDLN